MHTVYLQYLCCYSYSACVECFDGVFVTLPQFSHQLRLGDLKKNIKHTIKISFCHSYCSIPYPHIVQVNRAGGRSPYAKLVLLLSYTQAGSVSVDHKCGDPLVALQGGGGGGGGNSRNRYSGTA